MSCPGARSRNTIDHGCFSLLFFPPVNNVLQLDRPGHESSHRCSASEIRQPSQPGKPQSKAEMSRFARMLLSEVMTLSRSSHGRRLVSEQWFSQHHPCASSNKKNPDRNHHWSCQINGLKQKTKKLPKSPILSLSTQKYVPL